MIVCIPGGCPLGDLCDQNGLSFVLFPLDRYIYSCLKTLLVGPYFEPLKNDRTPAAAELQMLSQYTSSKCVLFIGEFDPSLLYSCLFIDFFSMICSSHFVANKNSQMRGENIISAYGAELFLNTAIYPWHLLLQRKGLCPFIWAQLVLKSLLKNIREAIFLQ